MHPANDTNAACHKGKCAEKHLEYGYLDFLMISEIL